MEEMFLEKLQEEPRFGLNQGYSGYNFPLGGDYSFPDASYNNKNDIDMSYHSSLMYPKLAGKFEEAYKTTEDTMASKEGDNFGPLEGESSGFGRDNYEVVNSNDSTNASAVAPISGHNGVNMYYNNYGKEVYACSKEGKEQSSENADKEGGETGAGAQYPFYVNAGIMPGYCEGYGPIYGGGFNGGYRPNYMPFGSDFTDNYAEYVNEVGSEFKEPENSTIDNESIESMDATAHAESMNVNMNMNCPGGFAGLCGGPKGSMVGGMGLEMANMPFGYQGQAGDLQSEEDMKPPLNRSDPIYTSISGLKWKSKSKKWVVRWDNPITNRRVYKYFSGNRYGFLGAHKRAKYYLEFLNASVGKVNAVTPGNPFCRRSEGPPKGKTNKSLIRKYYNSNAFQGQGYPKGPAYGERLDSSYANGMGYLGAYSSNGLKPEFAQNRNGSEAGAGGPGGAPEPLDYYNYIYSNMAASNKINAGNAGAAEADMVGSSMDNPWYTGQHY